MGLNEWRGSADKMEIETLMSRRVADFEDDRIRAMLMDRISPSKRIKSYILLALTNSCHENLRSVLIDICTAFELIQQASLIFDDTIDDDEIRDGGRVSMHIQFGGDISAAGKADHLGEFLLGQAELCINDCNLSPEVKIEIIRSFTETKLKAFQAQFADILESEKPEDMTWMNWCLQFSFQKTSEFMALPFRIAAIIHKMADAEQKQMVDCGRNLGIIYQIFDDLMDIREDVKTGTLALTYQLAFLLDNRELLSATELGFLDRIMIQRKLCDVDARELTELFKKHEDKIIEAATEEIQARSRNVVLPQSVSGQDEILEIIKYARQSAYWEYEDVDISTST